MGVPAEDQSHTLPGRLLRYARLVGQEDYRLVRIPTVHGSGQVGAVTWGDARAVVVVHARQVERRSVPLDGHPLIPQDLHAEVVQQPEPSSQIVEVLVVARDEEHPERGRQSPKGLHVMAVLGHRAFRQVAGDGHQVRGQGIRPVHHGLQPAAALHQVQVEVRELKDGESVHGRRQLRQRDLQALHHGPPERPHDADHGESEACGGCGAGCHPPHLQAPGGIIEQEGGAQQGLRPQGSGHPDHDPGNAADDVQGQHQVEGLEDQAEPHVDRDHDETGQTFVQGPAQDEGKGDARQGHHEQPAESGAPGGRDGRLQDEPPVEVPVDPSHDEEDQSQEDQEHPPVQHQGSGTLEDPPSMDSIRSDSIIRDPGTFSSAARTSAAATALAATGLYLAGARKERRFAISSPNRKSFRSPRRREGRTMVVQGYERARTASSNSPFTRL